MPLISALGVLDYGLGEFAMESTKHVIRFAVVALLTLGSVALGSNVADARNRGKNILKGVIGAGAIGIILNEAARAERRRRQRQRGYDESSQNENARHVAQRPTGRYPDEVAVVQRQQALITAGFRIGEIDGVWGPKSRTAAKQIQAAMGHPQTGWLTGPQLEWLVAGGWQRRHPAPPIDSTATTEDDETHTIRMQSALARAGYDVGEIDGRWGNDSRAIAAQYQRSRGEPITGRLNEAQLARLEGREPPAASARHEQVAVREEEKSTNEEPADAPRKESDGSAVPPDDPGAETKRLTEAAKAIEALLSAPNTMEGLKSVEAVERDIKETFAKIGSSGVQSVQQAIQQRRDAVIAAVIAKDLNHLSKLSEDKLGLEQSAQWIVTFERNFDTYPAHAEVRRARAKFQSVREQQAQSALAEFEKELNALDKTDQRLTEKANALRQEYLARPEDRNLQAFEGYETAVRRLGQSQMQSVGDLKEVRLKKDSPDAKLQEQAARPGVRVPKIKLTELRRSERTESNEIVHRVSADRLIIWEDFGVTVSVARPLQCGPPIEVLVDSETSEFFVHAKDKLRKYANAVTTRLETYGGAETACRSGEVNSQNLRLALRGKVFSSIGSSSRGFDKGQLHQLTVPVEAIDKDFLETTKKMPGRRVGPELQAAFDEYWSHGEKLEKATAEALATENYAQVFLLLAGGNVSSNDFRSKRLEFLRKATKLGSASAPFVVSRDYSSAKRSALRQKSVTSELLTYFGLLAIGNARGDMQAIAETEFWTRKDNSRVDQQIRKLMESALAWAKSNPEADPFAADLSAQFDAAEKGLAAVAGQTVPDAGDLHRAVNDYFLSSICSVRTAVTSNLQEGYARSAMLASFGNAKPEDGWCVSLSADLKFELRISEPDNVKCSLGRKGAATCSFDLGFDCAVESLQGSAAQFFNRAVGTRVAMFDRMTCAPIRAAPGEKKIVELKHTNGLWSVVRLRKPSTSNEEDEFWDDLFSEVDKDLTGGQPKAGAPKPTSEAGGDYIFLKWLTAPGHWATNCGEENSNIFKVNGEKIEYLNPNPQGGMHAFARYKVAEHNALVLDYLKESEDPRSNVHGDIEQRVEKADESSIRTVTTIDGTTTKFVLQRCSCDSLVGTALEMCQRAN